MNKYLHPNLTPADMKKMSWFLLMLIVLGGLTLCDKEGLYPVTQEGIDSSRAKLPPVIQDTRVTIINPGEILVEFNISDDGGWMIMGTGICWDTCRYPYKTSECVSWSVVSSKDQSANISNLLPDKKYYVRACAWNKFGTGWGEEIMFTTPAIDIPANVLNPDLQYGSVTDIDGNVYATVQIGTQIWMAENLRTTRYNDGSQIRVITAYSDGMAMNTAACYWYDNYVFSYINSYGALYNHYAVNAGNLCPTGWHVPDDTEWKKLEIALGMAQSEADAYSNADDYGEMYLGGNNVIAYRGTDQGTQMKATTGWYDWWDWNLWGDRNGNGTNKSGFSALPAGDVGLDGFNYKGSGFYTRWWCSGSPIARTLNGDSLVYRAHYNEYLGFSIRCLKD
jgi:uncharacterized protein (TIGR02145 family)